MQRRPQAQIRRTVSPHVRPPKPTRAPAAKAPPPRQRKAPPRGAR